jgi:phosphoribosyl-AMP cyclohydrolase
MNSVTLAEIDFGKAEGLVPVIAKERTSGKVLMLAYANQQAVEATLKTGFAHYWSRSRSKLWKKGEESGHVQRVSEVLVDCDADTLMYIVDQTGPACHTGEETCFFRKLQTS